MQCNFLGPESSLKVLAFGGEKCPDKNLLRFWKHPLNSTRLFSVYGVTEVSCWSTCCEIDLESAEEIVLGTPLPFNCLQVRSEQDGAVLSDGVGQLCLSTPYDTNYL
jgi:non-ribosomal peptide synthetase component F